MPMLQIAFTKGLRATMVLAASAFMPVLMASSQQCTRVQAIQAETEASTLKTWAEVFSSYRQYKQCDDGAIAEGYSDSVADLLTAHWDRVEELARLSAAHPGFGGFIVRHIDDLMTPDQYKVIRKQAKFNCPVTAKQLCAGIEKRFADLDALNKQ